MSFECLSVYSYVKCKVFSTGLPRNSRYLCITLSKADITLFLFVHMVHMVKVLKQINHCFILDSENEIKRHLKF